jgi:RNA polymerase sigma-70 factor (ECF subfamily)
MVGGELASYHLAHAAKGELNLRLGRVDEARASFAEALRYAQQEPERRHLERRLDGCRKPQAQSD